MLREVAAAVDIAKTIGRIDTDLRGDFFFVISEALREQQQNATAKYLADMARQYGLSI